MTEFRPEVCGDAARQGLMQWLLKRLRVKGPFDGNKLYASEVLSILLQNTPDNRQLLGDLEGIDVLLQQLAVGISFTLKQILQELYYTLKCYLFGTIDIYFLFYHIL